MPTRIHTNVVTTVLAQDDDGRDAVVLIRHFGSTVEGRGKEEEEEGGRGELFS